MVIGVGQVWRDPLGRVWTVRDVDAVREVAGMKLMQHALVVSTPALARPDSGWTLLWCAGDAVRGEVLAHLCRQAEAGVAS